MEYMLAFNESEGDFAERIDPNSATAKSRMGAWGEYIGAMMQAGITKGGNGLQPPHTGTTVRFRDGKRLVQDGPIADTKEQLGGYMIIDVPDLDTALGWAAKAPCAATGRSRSVRCFRPCGAAEAMTGDARRHGRTGGARILRPAGRLPFRSLRATWRLPRTRLRKPSARRCEAWPERGIPDRPEAWLLTVARRGHDPCRPPGRAARPCGRDVASSRGGGERHAGTSRARCISRRAAQADVRLRASGDRPRRAHAADAAGGAGARCGADRLGVPRARRAR